MGGKLGTPTVSPIELENGGAGRADTGFGVMTEEELKVGARSTTTTSYLAKRSWAIA